MPEAYQNRLAARSPAGAGRSKAAIKNIAESAIQESAGGLFCLKNSVKRRSARSFAENGLTRRRDPAQ
jgi:hypothetical protein